LNWWGSSMTKHPSSYPAFVVLFVSFLLFLVLDNTLGMLAPSLAVHYESSYSDYGSTSYASSAPGLTGTAYLVVFAFRNAIRLAYFLFLLILTIRLRSRLRTQYAIPEQTCTGCEDCCCAYWCHCCVVAQMARHVNDYEHQPAACCSDTGLQKPVPHIVYWLL
jgi:Cys-rich protein (TIGR01571 family)